MFSGVGDFKLQFGDLKLFLLLDHGDLLLDNFIFRSYLGKCSILRILELWYNIPKKLGDENAGFDKTLIQTWQAVVSVSRVFGVFVRYPIK